MKQSLKIFVIRPLPYYYRSNLYKQPLSFIKEKSGFHAEGIRIRVREDREAMKGDASGGARTRTPRGHKILSLGCLPVPTHSHTVAIIDHDGRESQAKMN